MSAAPTAVQKPEIVKPGTIHATSATMPAFSTSRNSPSVSDRERQRQDERERAHEGVDDAEQHARPRSELRRRREVQAVEDLARDPQAQRGKSRHAAGIQPCRSYSSGPSGRRPLTWRAW